MTEDNAEGLESVRKGLTGWLETQWKDATELEVSGMRKPEVGASNETLFFNVQWRENGESRAQAMVARLGVTSGPQVFQVYDLAMQYRIFDILGNTDVLVPRLYGYEGDESVVGAPFYLMGRLEGRLPTENPPYHAEGWLPECTPDERAQIWKSGIDAFSRIHRLDWKSLGFGFLDRPNRGETPLDQELDFYREFYDWTRQGRSHALCEEAAQWLEANKPQGPEPVGVVWGDAKLGNMIFQGTECVGLFDWELAHLGNPMDDVAGYLMLDRCLCEGIGIPRLSGFLSRDETVAYWEKVSGMKAVNFEYYEFLAYYRFSVIMYRIISLRKETGEWPADSDYEVWNLASNILEKEMALRR